MKKIALVSTGGTIAMQNNETGLAVPTAGAKELIGIIKSVKNGISWKILNLKTSQVLIWVWKTLLR